MRGNKTIVRAGLIIHLLGLTLIFESIFLLFALVISFIYDTKSIEPLFYTLTLIFSIGLLAFFSTNSYREKEPTRKESFVLVFFAWIILSLSGALPYVFAHTVQHFYDALFESVSGFTTTGASIITDVESVPRGILFWRSETHWMGGMGIILLILAVFPFFKSGAIYLIGAESSSVIFERIKPKLIDTVKRLWGIYILLTVLEIILLRLGGMELFDSICHAFGTVATGGFSTKNGSIGSYSSYIQYVVIVFMFLSGINFTLHYYLIKRKFKKVLADEELGFYVRILIIGTALITFYLFKEYHFSLAKSFREASFQVTSILTTTGFSSSDYNLWSPSSKAIILFLMLIGGCAGSTSGGIKVIRYVMAWKNIVFRIKKILFPNMTETLKYNNIPIRRTEVTGIIGYIMIYFFAVMIGTIILISLGLNFPVSLGSVATCIGGIGPGFDMTGPAGNYAMIPVLGKFTLMFLMILGRLEIFSVLIIFSPSFWKI